METRTSCEREHEFALVLSGIDDFDDEMMDALFEAGCDDATPSLRFGKVHLTFSRVAKSMREAILGAIRDVLRANIEAGVLRVDDCNLVTQAEIGRRSGRSRQVIHQYITGKRGKGNFPSPACQITEGVPLWMWCEVAYWLRQNDMIKQEDFADARDIDSINVVLDFFHRQILDPDEVEETLNILVPRANNT